MYFRFSARILLCIVLLATRCSALTPTNQSFSANSKYSYVGNDTFNVGKNTIDISSSIKSMNRADWASNSLRITINFP
jgi:hypothetical protein